MDSNSGAAQKKEPGLAESAAKAITYLCFNDRLDEVFELIETEVLVKIVSAVDRVRVRRTKS